VQSNARLVSELGSPNIRRRLTAQRLLIERCDSTWPAAQKAGWGGWPTNSSNGFGRIRSASGASASRASSRSSGTEKRLIISSLGVGRSRETLAGVSVLVPGEPIISAEWPDRRVHGRDDSRRSPDRLPALAACPGPRENLSRYARRIRKIAFEVGPWRGIQTITAES
jgi:hypothetical protein